MKKMIFMAPVAGLLLAAVRLYVVVNDVETTTGFVLKPVGAAVFYVLLILLAGAPFLLKRLMKQTAGEQLEGAVAQKNPVYAVALLIAGAGLLILAYAIYHDPEIIYANTPIWQKLCLGFCALAGVSFVLLIPAVFQAGSSYTKPLALAPLLCMVVLLLTVFMRYTGLANVMDRLLDYAMIILLMFFFMADARVRSGSGDYRTLYAYALSSSVTIFAATLPRLAMKWAGISYAFSFTSLSAAFLLLTPYVLMTAYYYCTRALQSKSAPLEEEAQGQEEEQ